MDPITHAVFGAGLAGLSGDIFSPYNPIYAAVITGAVAPDLDVITHLRGRLSFLKHHRGFSHSIPGLIFSGGIISIIISIDFPGTSLLTSFLWALGGGITHSLLDSLNIYGIRLLWPWQKKTSAVGLLNLVDPLLFLFFLPFLVFYQDPVKGSGFFFFLVFAYLFFRWLYKEKSARSLKSHFAKKKKIVLFPVTCWPFSWNFMVETGTDFFLGCLNYPKKQVQIQEKLPKRRKTRLILKALASPPGRLFSSFTSYCYISLKKEKNTQVVHLKDMRYRENDNFLYALSLIFKEGNLHEAYFLDQGHPIPLLENKK